MDPVTKLRGGDFSNIVKSHNGFAAVRDMKYTSQHCCDKTVDGRMALYREHMCESRQFLGGAKDILPKLARKTFMWQTFSQ